MEENSTADPGGGKGKPTKPISKSEIAYVNQTYRRILRSATEVARQAIDLGERLPGMKARVKARDELWEKWAGANLEFPLRTAQKFMKAAEDRHRLAALGPEGFMSWVWGHKPKELKEDNTEDKNAASGAFGKKEKKEEDKGDNRQSGGPGFNPGFFPDQGKPAFAGFKKLARYLNESFFESPAITEKEKLSFIEETVRWLEGRRKSIAAKAEKID